MRQVVLMCFPRDDELFAGRVAALVHGMSTRDTIDDLEVRLRDRYPHARLVRRHPMVDTPRVDDIETWYAFRDGSILG
jgi:hypothetical protein